MNAYDFDDTIFRGDSTFRFCLFCLRKNPRLLTALPRIAANAARFLAGRMDKTAFKEQLYSSLFPRVADIDALLRAFWQKNICRVKPWYRAQQRDDDLIISASPEFLLLPACEKLGIKYLIASRVDSKTGKYTGKNCSGKEKVARYRAVYGDREPEAFWSDSLHDAPMATISHKAFMVKGDKITPWP